MPATLKLEVGKTYWTANKSKIKIVALNGTRFVGTSGEKRYYEFAVNGTSYNISTYSDYYTCSDLVSEYKEPEYWYIAIYGDGSTNCRNSELELRYLIGKLVKAIIRINKETYQVEKLPL